MGYRHATGAKTVDEKIADVIASMSWVDVMIEYRISHFFNNLKTDFHKAELLRLLVLSELRYIDKVKILHKLLSNYALLPDKSFKKDFQRMGEIRNKIAHESVLITLGDEGKDGSVGSELTKRLGKQYDEFNILLDKYNTFIDDGDYMENPNYYSKKEV